MSASSPPLWQPRGGFGSEFSTVPVPELKTAAFVKLSEQLEKLVPVGTATFSCFAYCSAMPVSVYELVCGGAVNARVGGIWPLARLRLVV